MSALMRRVWIMLPLLLCLAGPSLATDTDPSFHIRVTEKPDAVAKGQAGRLELTISAAEELALDNIKLSGPGWSVVAGNGRFMTIASGTETALSFDLTPDGTWEKLTLTFEANGRPVTRYLDLSPPEILARKFEGTLTHKIPTTYEARNPFAPPTAPAELLPPIGDDKLPSYLTENHDPYVPPADKSTHSLTVHGRVGFDYEHSYTPVFGATVRALVRMGISNFILDSTTTDRDGYFSMTFQAQDGLEPYVSLNIIAGNDAFLVMEDNLVQRNTYYWRSATPVNSAVGDLYFGHMVCDGGYIGALNITNALSRANVFLYTTLGFTGLPWVDVWWPIADGSHYVRRIAVVNETPDIYYQNDDTWNNGTHIHEYGHHFIWTQALGVPSEYCNQGGYCDPDPGAIPSDCGHCEWCPENDNIAFTEGAPSWISDHVCKMWTENEATNPIGPYSYPRIKDCTEPYTGAIVVWRTEAIFSALLHDLVSPEHDNDPYFDGDHADNMTATAEEVLTVITLDEPTEPRVFIFDFKARYPQYTEELWATCRNNGYFGIDITAPVTGSLSSTSHPVDSTSPDNTIGIKVIGSTDDFSGVAGYNLKWARGGAVEPGYTITHPYTLSAIQTGPVVPGTYYLSVRTVDKAGNWTADYAVHGPVTVREPVPAELVPEPRNANWDYSVMPKDTQVASGDAIAADTDLLSTTTYWNACVANDGEISVTDHASSVFLDGVEVGSFGGVIPAWGDHGIAINQGPISVGTGRHVFAITADYDEIVAEPDETNNTWGKQWVWWPRTMLATSTYGQNSATTRTGGWDTVTDFTRWYNCYGFRITTQAGMAPSDWAAVWVRSDDTDGNLDVRIHVSSDAADVGYAGNIGYSYRPAGYLDAVLVNAANRPAASYDVGVITSDDEVQGFFHAQVVYGETLMENQIKYGLFAPLDGLDLYTFQVAPNVPYTLILEYQRDEGDSGPIWLAHYDEGFASGGLLSYDGIAVTDSTARLVFEFETPSTGYDFQAFAVWREPHENIHARQYYTITILRTTPDLMPNQPVGWAAPVVPRLAADATETSAPEPTILLGDEPRTYFNFSTVNASDVASVSSIASAWIDGVIFESMYHSITLGREVFFRLSTIGRTVRGGRHTLSLLVDAGNTVFETNEANNDYATQYVWRPTYMAWNSLITRAEPPSRTSGWDALDSEGTWWYNCDGQRTYGWKPSGTSKYWGAVAIMPAALADLDLDLHFWTNNPRDSFAAPLASSQWSRGQSDFVLMNFHNIGTKFYDTGIVQFGESTGDDYHITTASSVGLSLGPDGVVGTFNMGSSQILQLYEIDFAATGDFEAELAVADPALDLGFSLYGPDFVHGGKSDVIAETAGAWLATAGDSDSFSFTVLPDETGKHCLAVWKVGASDLALTSDYTLTITPTGVTGVDTPELPATTRLTGAYPNPFNPRTTIDFALAESAITRVTIHDLMGRRVATLVDGTLPSGHHAVSWQGQDDRGRRVASGTYFVQFRAAGVRETKKLTLVK